MSISAKDLPVIDHLLSSGKSKREIARILTGSSDDEYKIRRLLKRRETSDTFVLTQSHIHMIGAMLEEGSEAETIATTLEIPLSFVKRVADGRIVESSLQQTTPLDNQTAAFYSKMGRTVQKQRDLLRLERKHTRETSRQVNVLEELTEALLETFEKHKLNAFKTVSKRDEKAPVGIIQLSDIHFGERITENLGNRYDTEVAAARLKKLVDRAKSHFKAEGVETVLIAMTGDLINSDRRLDEITSNASNRADIIFTAVDILQQLISDVAQDFDVTVSSVCGNESRIGKDVGWVDFIASDSFDAIIHNILTRLFVDTPVKFVDMKDPLECLISVKGTNVLLIHGHNGVANTSRAENEVSKIKARYAQLGCSVDYVIFGHIHSAYISDLFARSSGLPGGNAYSAKALNLASRASQNIYIVRDGGSVDGMKVDLQDYDLDNAYSFNKETEAYKPSGNSTTVVIQSVLI